MILCGALAISAAALGGCQKSGKSNTPAASAQASGLQSVPQSIAGTAEPQTQAADTDAPDSPQTSDETQSPSVSPTPVNNDAAAAVVSSDVSDAGFAGAVTAVKDGETIYTSGDNCGDIYHVCSVSKQFTAAAVLMLYEEGRLDVNDTLDKYFPEYPHGAEITIHHLLSMSSGIPDHLVTAYDSFVSAANDSVTNRAAIKQWIFAQELDFAPGTAYTYCSANYFLLAEIIGQVTGASYEQFISQRILDPLGMTMTGFGDSWSKGGNIVGDGSAWFACKGLCSGSADMMSCASDLEKWGRELLEHRVVSANVFQMMSTPNAPSYSYGYGMLPGNDGFVFHDGNLPPYCSTVCVSADHDFVLVLLNCGDLGELMRLREKICADISAL